jgi:hypothetical protein
MEQPLHLKELILVEVRKMYRISRGTDFYWLMKDGRNFFVVINEVDFYYQWHT